MMEYAVPSRFSRIEEIFPRIFHDIFWLIFGSADFYSYIRILPSSELFYIFWIFITIPFIYSPSMMLCGSVGVDCICEFSQIFYVPPSEALSSPYFENIFPF
jgi:hypothetical protein